ncbi:MAG: hypothetical protein J6U70_06915 [Bacteroidales bacterium]|nr:hypothetical protein [Bacteroidales bacterium]
MMKKLTWSLLTVLALGLCVACDEDDSNDYNYMEGDIEYQLPDFCVIGDIIDLALEGEGITEPEDVQYNWIFDGDTTSNTKSIRLEIPDSAAVYWVTCFARYDGYLQVTNTQSITALDTVFNGSVSGLIAGTNTFLDVRDSRSYQYTTLGNLDWFVENLAYAGAGRAYSGNELMNRVYGRYYSWMEATGGQAARGLGNGPQGVCPEGWSIPTAEDWADLAAAVSEGEHAEFLVNWPNLGSVLSADAYENQERMWPYSPDNKHSNNFGWNAFPAGNSRDSHNRFENVGEYGMWWSAAEKDADNAYYRYIYYNQSDCQVHFVDKEEFGMTVRCVRKK